MPLKAGEIAFMHAFQNHLTNYTFLVSKILNLINLLIVKLSSNISQISSQIRFFVLVITLYLLSGCGSGGGGGLIVSDVPAAEEESLYVEEEVFYFIDNNEPHCSCKQAEYDCHYKRSANAWYKLNDIKSLILFVKFNEWE